MSLEDDEVRLPTPAELNRAHDESLELFGGLPGFKDARLVESAIEAVRMRKYLCPETTAIELAVALAYGLVKNHAYTDGNKRTATYALGITLYINGLELEADPILVEKWIRSLENATSKNNKSVQSTMVNQVELNVITLIPEGESGAKVIASSQKDINH